LCRHNQYFGVKAAQDFIKRGEGGIIWHTQGSGKSLTMVWLTQWIKEQGEPALESLPKTIRENKEATAETIENNLRRIILEESPSNPMYYEKMSVLLDELISLRKMESLDYETYLQEIIALTRQVKKPNVITYPASLNTKAKRNLYANLGKNEALANELDQKILTTRKDEWRIHKIKTKEVRLAIAEILQRYGIIEDAEIEQIFDLVKNQREY